MAEERAKRRLAAILAADVVGYSRMMGTNEAGTLTALKAWYKDTLQPLMTKHSGRVVKRMGDGVLAEFASAVNAVECAVEMQKSMAAANEHAPEEQNITLRIGINLGDVIVDGDDLYGDGVNVAARLEAMAEPGGICISDDAHRQVRDKVDITFDDAGEHRLKNIARPLRVFRVTFGTRPFAPGPSLTLPDKPSIAVLPFENMSGDVEQQYFSDGITEDIITELSRFRSLFVIARNSSFAFRGQQIGIAEIGRRLGVQYIVEGSVRRAGNRVRITAQLIGSANSAHLWADRFDGELEDIFDLQDRVTMSVVGAIAPKLEQAEIERSKRKPTESLDAYDYYLRGLAALVRWTREANSEALSCFRRAIEIDPNYASGYAMAARCFSQRKTSGWVTDRELELSDTVQFARRAAELGKDDALALSAAGFSLGYVAGEIEEGDSMIDRALALNPNLAWAWYYSGWTKVWLGEPEVAIKRLERALRLSPQDPLAFNMRSAIAYAHFVAGRYTDAMSWSEAAVRERPNHGSALRILAASCAVLGLPAQAEKAMVRLREADPALRISDLANVVPFRIPDCLEKLAEGLRKAGLPE